MNCKVDTWKNISEQYICDLIFLPFISAYQYLTNLLLNLLITGVKIVLK